MAEKMLMTKALDERDFLSEKISKKIDELDLVYVRRKKDQYVITSKGVKYTDEEFSKMVKSKYQEVEDMIARYNRLINAITQSNAETTVTVNDKTMTVAQAISLKNRIKTRNNFEAMIVRKMKDSLSASARLAGMYEKEAENLKNQHTAMVVGKDKNISEKDLDTIQSLVEQDLPEIIDPLSIADKYNELSDKYNGLEKEINTALKISNATTEIEF